MSSEAVFLFGGAQGVQALREKQNKLFIDGADLWPLTQPRGPSFSGEKAEPVRLAPWRSSSEQSPSPSKSDGSSTTTATEVVGAKNAVEAGGGSSSAETGETELSLQDDLGPCSRGGSSSSKNTTLIQAIWDPYNFYEWWGDWVQLIETMLVLDLQPSETEIFLIINPERQAWFQAANPWFSSRHMRSGGYAMFGTDDKIRRPFNRAWELLFGRENVHVGTAEDLFGGPLGGSSTTSQAQSGGGISKPSGGAGQTLSETLGQTLGSGRRALRSGSKVADVSSETSSEKPPSSGGTSRRGSSSSELPLPPPSKNGICFRRLAMVGFGGLTTLTANGGRLGTIQPECASPTMMVAALVLEGLSMAPKTNRLLTNALELARIPLLSDFLTPVLPLGQEQAGAPGSVPALSGLIRSSGRGGSSSRGIGGGGPAPPSGVGRGGPERASDATKNNITLLLRPKLFAAERRDERHWESDITVAQTILSAIPPFLRPRWRLRTLQLSGRMALHQQLEIAQQTQLLIGCHGAGMALSAFLAPLARVYEVMCGNRGPENKHYKTMVMLTETESPHANWTDMVTLQKWSPDPGKGKRFYFESRSLESGGCSLEPSIVQKAVVAYERDVGFVKDSDVEALGKSTPIVQKLGHSTPMVVGGGGTDGLHPDSPVRDPHDFRGGFRRVFLEGILVRYSLFYVVGLVGIVVRGMRPGKPEYPSGIRPFKRRRRDPLS